MEIFNNREIAIGIWMLIAVAYVMLKASAHEPVIALWRAFWKVRLVAPFAMMCGYIMLTVLILRSIGFWDISLLKDTLLWSLFGATALIAHVVNEKTREERILAKILITNFQIILLFEFVIGKYTFSLPAELILVPILTIITMLGAVASSDERYIIASKIFNGILAMAGLGLIYFASKSAISDWQNLNSLESLKSIALIPILSLTFIPFLYGISIYALYEQIFINLKIGREKSTAVKRYAKRRIIQFCTIQRSKLIWFAKERSRDLMRIGSEEDVDLLVNSMK